MFKSEQEKKIQALAKKYQKKDKRLSWSTCLKKARDESRLFGASA